MQTQPTGMVSKKPMLCLHPVTDEEGRPLDDEDESGTRLCTDWGRIFEARSEDERHHAYETILGFVQTAEEDIQWTIDKQEFDEMIATKKESAPGPWCFCSTRLAPFCCAELS